MRAIGHFVSGELVYEKNCLNTPVFNPSIAEAEATCSHASLNLVEKVALSAQSALPSWANTPPAKRASILFKFKHLVEENQERICRLISKEHGKTLADAKGELLRGIEVIDFACGIPQLLKGDYSQNVGSDIDSYSMHQPVGVCLGITPFNFPAMVPLWMFPIALACGNTFILKPSEKAPSAPLLLGELLLDAGLPKDVFYILNGGVETTQALIINKAINAISFVGSTPVAKAIYKTGSKMGKRVQALGGAKNHAIVMPDGLNQATIDGILGAAFGSTGQRCMALSVVVAVGEKVGDELVAALSDKIKQLKVGAYDMPQADIGPLHSQAHLEKVKNYIKVGKSEGAKLIADGRIHENMPKGPGFYLGPSLFDNVTPEMKIYQEEIFGPVLCVVRAKDYDEAVSLINQHQFGNGAVIFTQNGKLAREFSQHVKAGMVGINIPIPVPVSYYSFGGAKESLFGSNHIYGPDGVHFYTKLKTITTRWPDCATEVGPNYHFKGAG